MDKSDELSCSCKTVTEVQVYAKHAHVSFQNHDAEQRGD